MLKRLIFLVLGFMLLNINCGKTTDEEDKNDSNRVAKNSFEDIPRELIIETAKYLYNDDFYHFSLVSRGVYQNLSDYLPFRMFFIEKELLHRDIILSQIDKILFDEIYDFIRDRGRINKRQSITVLNDILNEKKISLYTIDESTETDLITLNIVKKEAKRYIKILNLTYGLGNKSILIDFRKLYHTLQEKMTSPSIIFFDDGFNTEILCPNLYILYYKIFSLLNSKVRESLFQKYKEGETPFKMNEEKCNKYLQPLRLPLDSTLL